MPDPKSPPDQAPTPKPAPELTSEDFYMDGPYLVFTAAYHRKRGECCGSGCQHCPFREKPRQDSDRL